MLEDLFKIHVCCLCLYHSISECLLQSWSFLIKKGKNWHLEAWKLPIILFCSFLIQNSPLCIPIKNLLMTGSSQTCQLKSYGQFLVHRPHSHLGYSDLFDIKNMGAQTSSFKKIENKSNACIPSFI